MEVIKMTMKKRMVSLFLALGMVISLSIPSFAGGPIDVYVTRDSSRTPEKIGTVTETATGFSFEGKTIGSVSRDYTGKTAKSGSEGTASITKGLDIADLLNAAIEVENSDYSKSNLNNYSTEFTAVADDFTAELKYDNIINVSAGPRLAYIPGLSGANYNNTSIGSKVDGVIGFNYTRNGTASTVNRLFTGVNQTLPNYADVVNFGFLSPTGVDKIVLKRYFAVDISGASSQGVTDEDYVFNIGSQQVKVLGSTTAMYEIGEPVTIEVPVGTTPVITDNQQVKMSTPTIINATADGETYTFTMPMYGAKITLN